MTHGTCGLGTALLAGLGEFIKVPLTRIPAGCLLFLLAAIALFQAQADIFAGARLEEVLQELGPPDASTKIGRTEVLTYKSGARVTIENGVVTEVSQRGQPGSGQQAP